MAGKREIMTLLGSRGRRLKGDGRGGRGREEGGRGRERERKKWLRVRTYNHGWKRKKSRPRLGL